MRSVSSRERRALRVPSSSRVVVSDSLIDWRRGEIEARIHEKERSDRFDRHPNVREFDDDPDA